MGIIINKPTPIGMDIVFFADAKMVPNRFRDQFIMMGGPVQTDRGFVIHSPIGNWQSSLIVNDDIAITTSRDILEQLDDNNQAVQDILLSIGYCAWRGGQLEQEISQNTWLTVPADQHILFHLPAEQRYHAALAKLGIRPEMLSSKGGHA